jgi:hypothetical protein
MLLRRQHVVLNVNGEKNVRNIFFLPMYKCTWYLLPVCHFLYLHLYVNDLKINLINKSMFESILKSVLLLNK